MKHTLELDEKDLREAVKEWLEGRGWRNVTDIGFERDGFPDSADPRERGVSYRARATVTHNVNKV